MGPIVGRISQIRSSGNMKIEICHFRVPMVSQHFLVVSTLTRNSWKRLKRQWSVKKQTFLIMTHITICKGKQRKCNWKCSMSDFEKCSRVWPNPIGRIEKTGLPQHLSKAELLTPNRFDFRAVSNLLILSVFRFHSSDTDFRRASDHSYIRVHAYSHLNCFHWRIWHC